MTTEETGLNEALQVIGVRVVETDLGEFIVQLDHDRPSHIVAPIIHKNRKVIAETLARELGTQYTEDPETLALVARRHLRDVFRHCDLGVTGVNFAVAQTGTLCICTNEGNGRFTSTRPKVHVALMGVEKLIPQMADLAVFLKILARSSTGQPITVYTSLIHGPRRTPDPDGPEQLHVVILDAGRRKLATTQYSQVLRCIRCGACLNACPVYRRIGGHAYGNVYPGPIGKVLAPLLNDFERYAELPQASSLCGACLEVCPVRIDIPNMLVRLRQDQVERGIAPWIQRVAFRFALAVLASPRLYRVGQRLVRLMTPADTDTDGEWIARLPGPLGRVAAFRDIPRPAARPFRRLWKKGENAKESAPVTGPDSQPATSSAPDRPVGARPASARPAIDPDAVRRVGPRDDLVAMFCEQAAAGGMHISKTSEAGLGQRIASLVTQYAASAKVVQPKVIVEPPLARKYDLGCLVADDGQADDIQLIDPNGGDDAFFAADVGVTQVVAAVAETGSIVCTSGIERWRGLSLIPPVHIAVVREDQIVPDLVDLFAPLAHGGLPAQLCLISGPSKTADIEGILITGVHGPREVHVIVVV